MADVDVGSLIDFGIFAGDTRIANKAKKHTLLESASHKSLSSSMICDAI
jgi:hypothetical protein